MKMGLQNDALVSSLAGADLIFIYRPEELDEKFDASISSLGSRLNLCRHYDDLVSGLESKLLAGDQLVFMSNGGFGAARQKLTMALQKKRLTNQNNS
jgi:UDP-N-acetylmuramate: L-alanyl-gamma-D-glutamyl-meso-diaminopimelate ligase